MAADDEQVRAVLVDGVAEDVPRLPLHHLYQSVHRVGDAEAARPVDDALRRLAQVRLHERHHVAGGG